MSYRNYQFHKKSDVEIVEMIMKYYSYKKNILYAFTETK